MKFGFLLDKKEVETPDINISPLPQYDEIVERFHAHDRVSRGWILPPLEPALMNPDERQHFQKNDGLKPSIPFSLPPTHEIETEYGDLEKEKFLTLGYGFLQGLYLIPEDHIYLWQVPYKPGMLTGLIPSGRDHENGMHHLSYVYDSLSPQKKNNLFGIIHWFLAGQSYRFLWDFFDAQYKVLDAIWKFSGLSNSSHAGRPEKLAKHYGLSVPQWALTRKSDEGTSESRLSKLRNDLVHEAHFADAPLGYALPEENFKLEFSAFNLKLICAVLGLETPYKDAPLEDRGGLRTWDFGGETPGT